MRISTRKLIGIGGLVALILSVQVAVCIRRNDWSELLEWEGWLWAFTPAAFMGAWGWIILFASKSCESKGGSKALNLLAILYFAVVIWVTADIILNGNSTSGIAFLLIPMFGTVVMLPLIGLVMWLGSRTLENANDR